MICRNCGSELPNGSKFCTNCGARTEEAPQQPQYQAPQYQQPQYQAPQYQQPQYQAPQYQQPQYQPVCQPPVKKKASPLPIILAAVAVVVLIAVGILLVLTGGKAPMEELFEQGEWTYGKISLFDGTYVIRKASTDVADNVDDIWDAISGIEVKEQKKGDVDAILEARNVDLFLLDDTFEDAVYLAVNEDGLMYINYRDEETRYFSGCRELYAALESFLPEGESASMEDCIPDGAWESMLITFYSPDGTAYDSAYSSEPADLSRVVERLQGYDAKFGGGTYGDFGGYRAVVSFFGPNDEMLSLTVFEDGNADLPMGEWTYGFYDAVAVYDLLWEELCIINGY